MTQASRTHRGVVRTIRTIGGLAFAASLIATIMVHVWAFGAPSAPWSPAAGLAAVATNLFWLSLFALHHSVFARTRARALVSRLVSADLERSVYVWVASLLLGVVLWQWVPVPGTAWHLSGAGAWLMAALQLTGVALTLYASAQLGVLQLAGLQSPVSPSASPPVLKCAGLYRFVRHPIYFAWLMMVWPTPVMTGSRLTFAVLTTVYLMIAVPLEERSLRAQFGRAYDDYTRTVRWRMLPGVY